MGKSTIMRFNIYGNLINPEPNGMYVRHEDHARAVAALELELAATRHAALTGMDAAKRVSTIQLQEAQRARAESAPEVLASEREANAILTAENEALHQDAERLNFIIDKQGIIVSQTGADGVRRFQLYQICEYGTGFVLSGKNRWFDTPRASVDAAREMQNVSV